MVLLIGANPTDAHPVFASRLKKRLRAGARDHRGRPAPDRPGARPARRGGVPPAGAARHQRRVRQRPGPRRRDRGSRRRGLPARALRERRRTTWPSSPTRRTPPRPPRRSPASRPISCGLPPASSPGAGNGAIYYGLGVTEHSQGSTMVMGMANLAMLTGNLGREGVGVNPLRGQNNVQGSCDMGSFPHEFPGYRHVSRDDVRGIYEQLWGRTLDPEPGLRIPNMFDSAHRRAASAGSTSRARTSPSRTPTPSTSRPRCDRWTWSSSRTSSSTRPPGSPTSSSPARPSWRRTAPSPTPNGGSTGSGRCSPPRQGKDEWQITCDIAQAMGYDMGYAAAAEIMDEIAATTPDLRRGLLRPPRRARARCSGRSTTAAPHGTPTMHVGEFVRGKGQAGRDRLRADDRAVDPAVPADPHHRPDPQPVQRRRPDAAYRQQHLAPRGRLRDPPRRRAAARHLHRRPGASSRAGSGRPPCAPRCPTGCRPGVVYTTFHHPVTGANVVTTENSDWATNCPEYKVTAVRGRRGQRSR